MKLTPVGGLTYPGAVGGKKKKKKHSATRTRPAAPAEKDKQTPAEKDKQAPAEGTAGFWRRHGNDLLPLIPILLVAAILFGWGIGSYSLSDPWEAKYPQAVREMFERGEIITPYYGDEIRWTKPILIYWAQMIPVLIWGNNEFSARLPSVLAALWGLLVIYWCLLRLRGRATAILGASVLATLPVYYFMARQSMPDMLLTASLASAMSFLALGRFGQERNRLYFLLFYASVGLGFLAKGPVTGAITVGALLVFWAIDFDPSRLRSARALLGDFTAMLKRYHVGPGVLVFLVVVGVWYLPVWIKHGEAFVDHFIMWQNVQRFADTAHLGLDAPSSAYVKTVMHGMYPWFAFLPAALLVVLGRRERDEECRQGWFFCSWLIAVLLIFSAANTKLDHYVLPATVPVAVLVALVWERYLADQPPFWMPAVFLLSMLLVVLPIKDFVSLSTLFIMDAFTNRREIDNIDVTAPLLVFLAGWAVIMLAAAVRRRSRLLAGLAVACAFGIASYFSLYVLPRQEQVRSVEQYVDHYRTHRRPDSVLVMVGRIPSTLMYYAGGHDKFLHVKEEELDTLPELLQRRKNVFMIAEVRLTGDRLAGMLLSSGRKWHLIDRSNPHCIFFTDVGDPSASRRSPR